MSHLQPLLRRRELSATLQGLSRLCSLELPSPIPECRLLTSALRSTYRCLCIAETASPGRGHRHHLAWQQRPAPLSGRRRASPPNSSWRLSRPLLPRLQDTSERFPFLREGGDHFFSYTLAIPHFTLSSPCLQCLEGLTPSLRTRDPR